MKVIKLLTLLILISLQAGATGYSHNMFVAHKKLQAGKECRTQAEHITVKKSSHSKVQISSQSKHTETSITKKFANKLSGVVTLNQRVLEEGPSSLFSAEEDEQQADNSIVSKLVVVVKGMVFAFVGASNFGRS